MTCSVLDFFGELLVKRVRDEAIIDWEMILDGRMKDEGSQRIRARIDGLNQEQRSLLWWLIPKIVDTTLHHLLWTLEQEEAVDVAVRAGTETTENIREASDGLAGELYGDDGWLARFSSQPVEEP